MTPEMRFALRTGLWASLYLAGPIILTFVIAFGLGALPFHIDLQQAAPIFFILFLVLCGGGGWLWGRKLGASAAVPEPDRMAWAGSLSFGPMTVIAALGLGLLERLFVEQGASKLPIYIIFAILFVSATFIVSAVMGIAYGIALRSRPMTWKLALAGGLAGALAFLLLVVILDVLGRRVGGPNAAATATMLTTLWAGNILAAYASGAVSVWLIRRFTSGREVLAVRAATD
jgi:hypothetical protein